MSFHVGNDKRRGNRLCGFGNCVGTNLIYRFPPKVPPEITNAHVQSELKMYPESGAADNTYQFTWKCRFHGAMNRQIDKWNSTASHLMHGKLNIHVVSLNYASLGQVSTSQVQRRFALPTRTTKYLETFHSLLFSWLLQTPATHGRDGWRKMPSAVHCTDRGEKWFSIIPHVVQRVRRLTNVSCACNLRLISANSDGLQLKKLTGDGEKAI